MHYDEAGTRIILESERDLYIASEVVDASRYFHEGRKRPLHPEPPLAELPWQLGTKSSEGLMSALERAAEDHESKLQVTPEIRSMAAHLVAQLNEQLGERRDAGLLGRLATALSSFDIKLGIFF